MNKNNKETNTIKSKDKKETKYLKLFTSTFYLSAFTFGGGYVIVPLMKEKFVTELGWLNEEEMLNFAAIAQSSPGAVAVNAAMLVGFKVGGAMGALVATLGTVLPPLLIISVISLFYEAFRQNNIVNAVLNGIQIGVAAVITSVVINMGGIYFKLKDWLSVLIMLAVFVLTYFFSINVAIIIISVGILSGLRTLYKVNKKGEK